jgi:hypothetical protein
MLNLRAIFQPMGVPASPQTLPAGLPFKRVMETRKNNTWRAWLTQRTSGESTEDENSARGRLISGEIVLVANRPRFSIKKGARVYTIGSCFARNIERALAERDILVPNLGVEIPAELYAGVTAYKNTVLNKYNAHSMAAEIIRGIEGEAGEPNIVEAGPDQWFDPEVSFLRALPRDQLLSVRRTLEDAAREVVRSDVVLMTFGLTETWVDHGLGVALNSVNVGGKRRRKHVQFFNATVDQVVAVMSDALERLRAANRDVKVVATVSPVPMSNTFTDMDVISANTYSKSTLRVACEVLKARYDFVDYFPSFEMVMHSPRESTWYPDNLHVRNEVVSRVIREFVARYVVD